MKDTAHCTTMTRNHSYSDKGPQNHDSISNDSNKIIMATPFDRRRSRRRIRRPSARSLHSGLMSQYHLLMLSIILIVFTTSPAMARRWNGPISSSSKSSSLASTQKSSEVETNSKVQDDDDDAAVLVVSEVLQITETEMWDGSKWKSSGASRWTKQRTKPQGGDSSSSSSSSSSSKIGSAASIQDGQPCASPDKQEPPNGMKFDGDWKIVTGGSSRDNYGWEYTIARPFPVRQRVWLRNLVPKKEPKKEYFKISRKNDNDEDDYESTDDKKKQLARKRKKRKMPQWIRAVSDDFNFKGFGLSFYKSLVFAESFGMAFRIPLTYNFGRFETNRGLPSVSSSIGLYFPGTAMISISTSVRLEFLKWISGRIVETALYLLVAAFWTFVRGIILAVSAVLFPITRKLYQPPVPIKAPWARYQPPVFSRTTEERLGCSISWRVSRTRGYHFRVSYWHYYAQTLASMWPTVQALASVLQNKEKATMPDWWARRSAAFGLSTSGPIPDPPFVTSSLALSLSGYYFRPAQAVRLVASPSSVLKGSISPRQEDDVNAETAARNMYTSAGKSMAELDFSNTTSDEEMESDTEESEAEMEGKLRKSKKI